MHFSIAFLLWALVSYVIYQTILLFVNGRRHATRAKRLGCQPAPWFESGFLGIANLREALQADKEKLFPDLLVDRLHEVSVQEGRQVSTYCFEITGQNMLFTADPKNIQALLAVQFRDFELGKGRRGNFWPLLGLGIFTADGKDWEHSRALMRPQFARSQVSDLDLEERHVQNMMLALPTDGDGWTAEVDIQVLFFRLTLDSATEFLFGESVDSQLAALSAHPNNHELEEASFASAFDRSQWYLARRARFGDRHWMVDGREFRKVCKGCHDFVDHFVRLALDSGTKEKELGNGRKREKYVFLEALAAQTRDPLELRYQLLNILLAGRDTTASLLSWLFMLLNKHPSVFSKLRQAILEDFGTRTNPKVITFSGLKSCRYLQHCLNEALRIFPVVPVNSRRATTDTTLPRGGGPDGLAPVYIRKGQEVNYSVYVMHRRRDLWGDDMTEFKPERWVGRRPGWEYVPFNGGPRICIGQQFALTEASYVTVRLLQRFDAIQGDPPANPIRHGLTLTDCPADGVKVRLHQAAGR